MYFSCELYIYILMLVLSTVVPSIIAVAFFTVSERKIMAFIQRREGPNVAGVVGLLQPLADGLKLLIAESIIVRQAPPYLFILSATLPLIFSLFQWSIIPIGYYKEITNNSFINVLYLFPIAMGSTYGVVLSGWASNSKYATLGSFRSVAQLISYDIPMLLSLIPIFIACGSLNITEIGYIQSKTLWFFFVNPAAAVIFFITALAETNRAPFDLPEAEAELVAGFNVEYSAMTFALFFLGEYGSMLLMSVIYVQLFFGEDTISDISLLLFIIITVFFCIFRDNENVLKLANVLLEIFAIIFILILYVKLMSFNLLFLAFPMFYKIIVYPFLWVKLIIYCISGLNVYFSFSKLLIFLKYFLVVIKIPYSIKVVLICTLFVVVRAITPRYRYDQLMGYCWKVLIPLSISTVTTTVSLLIVFNGFVSSFW